MHLINTDIQNGYGYYYDLDDNVSYEQNNKLEYDSEYDSEDDYENEIDRKNPMYNMSLFTYLLFNEPCRCIIICAASCLTTCLFCHYYDKNIWYSK